MRSFPDPQRLAEMMDAAGFTEIRWLLLAGRHHRHPQRDEGRMTRSSIPPPVTAVMDAASAWLPARMAEVEERLAELSAGHGPGLGEEAEATLTAGGKRMRPLLVLMAAGDGAGDRAVRAATAVELVHMATLVHDDVLDGAPVRRGRPTVVARSGRDRAVAVGDLLFSRAFAELAADGGEAEVAELSSASVALALGELAQRHDAFDTSITEERYLERCSLKTARLFESACRVGRIASGRGRHRGARRLRPRDRPRLPAPRRRPRRHRPAGADREGPRHRPARRHGDAAPDPGPRARPGARVRRAAGARPGRPRRRSATGSPRPALDEVRDRAKDGIGRAKEILDAPDFTDEERELLGLIADGVVERYA